MRSAMAPLLLAGSLPNGGAALDRGHRPGHTAWSQPCPGTGALRDSEVLGEEERFSIPTYRFYERNGYRFYDCLQMNLVYSEHVLGRLSLYRTRREGLFTGEGGLLSPGSGQPYQPGLRPLPGAGGEEPREGLPAGTGPDLPPDTPGGGDLGPDFQDWNNEEILEKLRISRYTLLKHLQNIYRKCGVSSRWDFRKLGP